MVTFVNVPAPSWLLLSSRLPREPTRLRLGTWRRLRRLGAVLINDTVWVLPAEPRTRESFEWMVQEISEAGGTAYVWEATSLGMTQDQELTARFQAASEARCRAIVAMADKLMRPTRQTRNADLTRRRRKLRTLERALRLERQRDWFRSPAWTEAERKLRSALAELEAAQRSRED